MRSLHTLSVLSIGVLTLSAHSVLFAKNGVGDTNCEDFSGAEISQIQKCPTALTSTGNHLIGNTEPQTLYVNYFNRPTSPVLIAPTLPSLKDLWLTPEFWVQGSGTNMPLNSGVDERMNGVGMMGGMTSGVLVPSSLMSDDFNTTRSNRDKWALSGGVVSAGMLDLKRENAELQKASKDALEAYRRANSGALIEARQSLTGAQRDALKDVRKSQVELIRSLSGAMLEDKLKARDALEAAQKAKLGALYATNTGLLASRLAVYEANKERRAQVAANKLAMLLDRSAMKVEHAKVFVTKVMENLADLTPKQKAKLVTKIQARIQKVNANKNLTTEAKAALVMEYGTLEGELKK